MAIELVTKTKFKTDNPSVTDDFSDITLPDKMSYSDLQALLNDKYGRCAIIDVRGSLYLVTAVNYVLDGSKLKKDRTTGSLEVSSVEKWVEVT